jgi:hypothetical protein
MRTGLIIGVLAALAAASAHAESWDLIRNDKDEALAVELERGYDMEALGRSMHLFLAGRQRPNG